MTISIANPPVHPGPSPLAKLSDAALVAGLPGEPIAEPRSPGYLEDLAADQLVLALGLARRPRVLPLAEFRDLLLFLADVERTARRYPEFAAQLRALFAPILETT